MKSKVEAIHHLNHSGRDGSNSIILSAEEEREEWSNLHHRKLIGRLCDCNWIFICCIISVNWTRRGYCFQCSQGWNWNRQFHPYNRQLRLQRQSVQAIERRSRNRQLRLQHQSAHCNQLEFWGPTLEDLVFEMYASFDSSKIIKLDFLEILACSIFREIKTEL